MHLNPVDLQELIWYLKDSAHCVNYLLPLADMRERTKKALSARHSMHEQFAIDLGDSLDIQKFDFYDRYKEWIIREAARLLKEKK